MVVFPNAKINLGLKVIEKRPDGYHNIETVFYPLPVHDVLEIIPDRKPGAREVSLFVTGIEVPGEMETNLCVKAYRLLKDEFDLPPVEIHLHKAIPMGAGLGGGSSDGAFTLVLLNQMFNLHLRNKLLEQYAAKLGSDCPFFIRNSACLATGRGEVMENIPFNLRGLYFVLVHPGIHAGTAEAYAGIRPARPEVSLKEVIDRPVSSWGPLLKNDFEEGIFIKHPEIKEIKEKLYGQGAIYAAMTGSGSAVFGLFEQLPGLKNLFPGMYYREDGF